MCAMEAARRGRSVVVLDHARTIAGKVRISGGGRCNFTNLHASFEHYACGNPNFTRSALARFTPLDFLSILETHGICSSEKKWGQMFSCGGAGEIAGMLIDLCRKAGVEFATDCGELKVHGQSPFLTEAASGTYESESVVVATGGLSMPALGATGFGYKLAAQYGLRVTPLRPALTPLLFAKDDRQRFTDLSGVSLDAIVNCGGRRFQESILFTHNGLSGPAILQASLYWRDGESISVDLLPGIDFADLAQETAREKIHLVTLLGRFLPRRFAVRWCELHVQSRPLREYSRKELLDMEAGLHAWTFVPAGVEGFEKAEVTAGGVDTRDVSSKTMEARHVPGLYFAGEVLDVTGQLGGFNLHWAWSSGFTAGQYA